jgi:hypothetical protein
MSAALIEQLPEFIRSNKLATIPDPEDPKEDTYDGEHVPVNDIDKAHIVLSTDDDGWHRPVLDIDFPAALIPSSTPGHFHLYLDKKLSTSQYMKLLDALAEAGIIEQGYASVSEARGYTSARLPWVKKKALVTT